MIKACFLSFALMLSSLALADTERQRYEVTSVIQAKDGMSLELAMKELGIGFSSDPKTRRYAEEGVKTVHEVDVLWNDNGHVQIPRFGVNWQTGRFDVYLMHRDADQTWIKNSNEPGYVTVALLASFEQQIIAPKEELLAGTGSLRERWQQLVADLQATPAEKSVGDLTLDITSDGAINVRNRNGGTDERWELLETDELKIQYQPDKPVEKWDLWKEQPAEPGGRFLIDEIPENTVITDQRTPSKQSVYRWEGELPPPGTVAATAPSIQGMLPIFILGGIVLLVILSLMLRRYRAAGKI